MKSIKYFIYTTILFLTIFTFFSIILYINIKNEIIKDEYVKNDELLANVSQHIQDDIKDFCKYNFDYYNEIEIIPIRSINNKLHISLLDSFIKSDYLICNYNNNIYLYNDSTLLKIPNGVWEKNIFCISNFEMNINTFGYNWKNEVKPIIKEKLLNLYSLNRNYGFFETKEDIVNYRSFNINGRYAIVLEIKTKTTVFKQLNNFALLFGLVIFVMLIIMSTFIVFYMEAYSQLLKKEEKTKHEAELIKLNKLMGIEKLSSTLVHDINNPLTAAIGFLEILDKKEKEISEKFKIPVIINNLKLVGDKIKISLKRTKREMSGEMEIFNVNTLISDKIELHHNLFSRNHIKTRLTLQNNIPDIKGYYGDYSLIIDNLIENAIDSMSKTKTKELHIQTNYNEKFVYIKIEDSGCGIPQSIREKIYDLYFTTKEKGTGIGMYSVIKSLKRNNAFLHLDSSENKGTIFTITIPLN